MFTIFRSVVQSCRSVPVDLTVAFLGPGAAGKTSIAAIIKGDPLDEVSETIGQDIFHFRRKKANITAYDLGGGERIRGIWERYYAEVHAFVYVVDASETLEEARAVLWEMMQHRFVGGKPVLIFANKQDVDGAHASGHVSSALDLSELAAMHGKSPFHLVEVSALGTNKTYVLRAVDWLIAAVLDDYGRSSERRRREMAEQQEIEDRERKEKQERIRKRREERERLRQQKEEEEQRAEATPTSGGGGGDGSNQADGEQSKPAANMSTATDEQASVSHDAPCLLPGEAEAPQSDDPAPLTSVHRVEAQTADSGERKRTEEAVADDLEVEEMGVAGRERAHEEQQQAAGEGDVTQGEVGEGQQPEDDKEDDGKEGQTSLFQRVRSPAEGAAQNSQQSSEAAAGAKPPSQAPSSKKPNDTVATKAAAPAVAQTHETGVTARPRGPVKLSPLHPLDVISSVKSIKDAPLIELVRAAARAYAKLRGEPEPGEGDLQWKMYRAACKECWQQIIKQARKGKRFSMDRLAVQAHAGWSAIVKHAWDRAAYGPRPPQLTPHTDGWPRDLFETAAGYEVYRQRWEEAQSFDALTYEQKERYRLIAEVELHMFLTKNAGWRGLPVKHRQQKLFEALLVLECVSVHEPEASSTA